MYLTTICVRNGPPGYCDTDYEYLYTEDAPTEKFIEQFIRDACSHYTHVRKITARTVKLSTPDA